MTRAAINFNLLIKFLGSTILVCAIGGIGLASFNKPVPDFIIQLGGSALAAMGAAFIRPPETGPQSVTIADEPVEVTTTTKPKKNTLCGARSGRSLVCNYPKGHEDGHSWQMIDPDA